MTPTRRLGRRPSPLFPLAGGGKIFGWQRDEDQALGKGGNVIEIKRALTFLGAALAERQQPAKPAVSGAIARINQQARRVQQIEPGADDEFDADFLGGQMAAHDAGERVAVGDGDGVELKRLGRRHQFLGMGAAAQEGEIGGDVELGVAGHGE